MDKDQKILITGATGLVGAYLIRYLLLQGYTGLTALRRKQSELTYVHDFADRIQWVECDLLDVEDVFAVVAGMDVVIHAAALVSYDPRMKDAMMKVNQKGTENIVNAALEAGVEKLVYIGSVAALGKKSMENKNLSEDTEWVNSDFTSDYGISKYLAEMEVWRGMAEGLSVLVMLPSFILGTGDYSRTSLQLVPRMAKGMKYYPPGSNGFVDVRDVASITVKAMELGISNERFIVSAENHSYQNLMELFAYCFGRPVPDKLLSSQLAGWLVRFASLKRIFTGSVPAVSRQSMQNLFMWNTYNNQKSRELLQFRYRPIEETLGEVCKKYSEGSTAPLPF